MDRYALFQEKHRLNIVERYTSGERLVPIARAYKTRASVISRVLREAGINVDSIGVQRAQIVRTGKQHPIVVHRNPGLTGTPTAVEWAYTAGLFDGEGCLTYANRNSGNSFGHRVQIAQAQTEIHEWLISVLGGGTYNKKGSGPTGNMYHFKLCSQKKVFQFLEGVLPYLRIKKVPALAAYLDLKNLYNF